MIIGLSFNIVNINLNYKGKKLESIIYCHTNDRR